MKISVITVVFNAVDTIKHTIRSVIDQDYKDIEHIVIDGGSTDGTMDVVNSYRKQLAVVISEPDKGIYDAMNKGIELASGDIIGTLNSDDWYADKEVLSRVARAFSNDKHLDAVYGDIVFVTKDKPHGLVRYWESQPYKEGLFEKGWMPAHPSFFVKRDCYSRYGKFDLDLKIQSDFDLTMRFMVVHKIKTRYLPGVMVKMRMGGVTNNRISNVIKGNYEAYRACKKNGLSVTPLFMVKKVFSRIPQFFRKPE
ncbi:MAG: glycosyltransferase family 2 protein [Pseudomonadota bacterium]|nr:glycosyltransferase family 2 protein [Pseudomonadota bacterium]